MVTMTAVDGVMRVTASHENFTKLLRTVIADIEVNESWYLGRYEDVTLAVRNGTVESAKAHFVHDGYFEGRLPFPIKVDERWYLSTYLDVAEHVRKATFPSGQAHFDAEGYREGRLPFKLV